MGDADEMGGRVIAGRYRLRAPLGSGGMGEVWEAYDERLDGRRVAVKMMLDEHPSASPVQGEALEIRRQRFLREVRTTARIEHPGIPAVFDAGVDPGEGRLFVVMQLLRGRELQTLIDETDHAADPLPVARAAAIGAQVASVLDEVHRHDVVHRDIKPSNLMLTPGGIVKVLDFGVASLQGSGDNPRLTQVGLTVGTPPYMSPEQALGNNIGPTSDVYALACVMYELLTGRPVFADLASPAVSHQTHHVHSTPRPISDADLRPDAPEEMASLFLAMLAKETEKRPAAAEVYERLLPFAARPMDVAFAADIANLDPCLPFVRPMGGRMRRPAAPSQEVTSPAPATGPAITEREIEELAEHVEALLHDDLFTEAIDLLEEARGRAAAPELANDLSFKLAQVRYIAGNYSEAAELFIEVGAYFTERYGAADPDAQIVRYYVGQCRAELGDVTGAVEAFQDVADAGVDGSDGDALERHLDALAVLMRLYAVMRRQDLFEETAAGMREAILRHHPDERETMLAELDAYKARLARLLAGFEDGGA